MPKATGSARPFAVFDIDGTLLRWQLYHAVAGQLVKNGAISEKEFAHVKQILLNWKRRESETSYADYELELIKTYELSLEKITFRDYILAAEQAFDEYKDQTYIYTRDLVKNLKDQGYLLFALSASQVEIVAMLANYYGFDDWGGTKYSFEYGQYSGKKHILKGTEKAKLLQKLIKKYDATTKGSIAVGDSEGDVAMLELAEKPIAFNPTKDLYQTAKQKGWKIVVESKSTAYELEPSKNKVYKLV